MKISKEYFNINNWETINYPFLNFLLSLKIFKTMHININISILFLKKVFLKKGNFLGIRRVRNITNSMYLIFWKVFNSAHSDSRRSYEKPRAAPSGSWKWPLNQNNAMGETRSLTKMNTASLFLNKIKDFLLFYF